MSSVRLPDPETLSAIGRSLPQGASLCLDSDTGKLFIEFTSKDSVLGSSVKSPDDQPLVRPKFLRLPKGKVRCPYSGLTRSMMDSLVRPCAANKFRPPVRSSRLKQAGTAGRRGAVLIDAESLFEFLDSQSRLPLQGDGTCDGAGH